MNFPSIRSYKDALEYGKLYCNFALEASPHYIAAFALCKAIDECAKQILMNGLVYVSVAPGIGFAVSTFLFLNVVLRASLIFINYLQEVETIEERKRKQPSLMFRVFTVFSV